MVFFQDPKKGQDNTQKEKNVHFLSGGVLCRRLNKGVVGFLKKNLKMRPLFLAIFWNFAHWLGGSSCVFLVKRLPRFFVVVLAMGSMSTVVFLEPIFQMFLIFSDERFEQFVRFVHILDWDADPIVIQFGDPSDL